MNRMAGQGTVFYVYVYMCVFQSCKPPSCKIGPIGHGVEGQAWCRGTWPNARSIRLPSKETPGRSPV